MYDLHSHSNFSDGILRPQDLVSRAKEQGVTTLALTDHDTTAGLSEAKKMAGELQIELIEGIELSSLWRGIGIHIVGLKVDSQHPVMQQAVQQQLESREQRARQIAVKLEKCGFHDTYAGAAQFAGDGIIGRPHFARHLVAAGHVKNEAEAFKSYLGAGKVGDVKQLWPDIATAVGWIRASGGVAVLAHPDKYNMTRTKLRALLDLFVESGGQAIEVVSGKQQSQVTRDMAVLAERYGLWASCGSDFHVPNQPWQELGSFTPLPEKCDPVWCHW
ncbi:MAG: PHP domain-containing protein [Candidatus Pelagadaptatus aseana]